MSELCKSFDSSLIDPSLMAMDVDRTSTAEESVLDVAVAGPALRPGVARRLESRQNVPPEFARPAIILPQDSDAASSGRRPAGLAIAFPASWGIRPPHAPPRDWSKDLRSIEFTRICNEYLQATDRPYPSARDRAVREVVLELGDVYTVCVIYAHFRRTTMPRRGEDSLSDDDWAVIAYNLIRGAPPNGTLVGALKTTRDIAGQVRDIHDRFVRPVCEFCPALLDKERASSLALDATNSLNPSPGNSRVLPSQSQTSRNALGLTIASPTSVSRPQHASLQDVADGPIASTTAPPTRLELIAQVVQSLYKTYLTVWVRKPMPSDAERTVAGKVIDIFVLMAVIRGCQEELGRPLTLSDFGGLAVAHFGFPRHTRILVEASGHRRLIFWASTSEVALGLSGVYARHLEDFHVRSPFMQAGLWGDTWNTLIRRLCITVPAHEEEPQNFVQVTDIAPDIAPDSPAARAAGLVAVEAPGVTGAADRSARAQRLFTFTLGFSPISDIQQRVLARMVKDPRDGFWGEPVRPFNLGSEQAQEWLVQWTEFLGHRERALVIGPKRIHETLKHDTATEKLLFMLAAYDSMHLGDCRSPPTEAQREAAALGFPPRHLVTANTLEGWNVDFKRIWAHFDRLVGPLAFLPRTAGVIVPPMGVQPGRAMQEARKFTASGRPLSNHKAHEKRHRALPKKSATWIGAPKLLTRTKSSVV